MSEREATALLSGRIKITPSNSTEEVPILLKNSFCPIRKEIVLSASAAIEEDAIIVEERIPLWEGRPVLGFNI